MKDTLAFDPTVDFTPAEIEAGLAFLQKVKARNYYWPDGMMEVVHSVVSFWAPEIVIFDRSIMAIYGGSASPVSVQVLLAIYEGGAPFPPGTWHIPGGYNKWPEPDIQATVSRVARRGIGMDARFNSVLDVHKWGDEHPYGHPLSLYCWCEPEAPIAETEKLRFFRLDELPSTLVPPHRRFLESLLR